MSQETADLVTFTEEILNGQLKFFCSDKFMRYTNSIEIEQLILLHFSK